MANFNDRLKDYVQVNERIIHFYEKYPDGSIQPEIIKLDDSQVVMRACAFRTPDDPRPAIGHSRLAIPGTTPYTEGSELENCETSAVGRALAMLGFEVKRGIASGEEVQSKQHDPNLATEAQRKSLVATAKRGMGDGEGMRWIQARMMALGIKSREALTIKDFKGLMAELAEFGATGEHVEPIHESELR